LLRHVPSFLKGVLIRSSEKHMRGFWKNCSRLLALALCHLIAVQPILSQQNIRIVVVEGRGARHVVQQTAAPITVRVEDLSGRALVGATVTFVSPQGGPSGEFGNDQRTIVATTDSGGVASTGSYHPNDIAGAYNIAVRAELQNQVATIQIPQENISRGKGHGKLIAILVIAGAAVAAVVASSLKKDGPQQPTTPPTITPGTSTVGAPTTP
jgi:hypothetical protein